MYYAVIDDSGFIEKMVTADPGKSRTDDGKMMIPVREQDGVDPSWTFHKLRGEFISVRTARPHYRDSADIDDPLSRAYDPTR